ncbi:Uma2 family endonuclease [Lusitaniella coriacea]|uniref:Uma2 family endonuclease n=1 Tax=Lusitaniella coriacea TaxID=1983105 RepID=UPI003CE8F9FD
MTATAPIAQPNKIFYPSEDGTPVAETYDHLYAILATLDVLTQYLNGRQATVLANQFLYYSQGFPSLRVAPDVMVIFDVAPGGRDNYKIWEEGQVPSVIFEMTSKDTQDRDKTFKKTLYEQLGVREYWLFDPKGEWIAQKLQGYRLQGKTYQPITMLYSEPLQLRLEIEGKRIGFYREDTGEKLLVSEELVRVLNQETQAKVEAQQEAEQERQRAEQERQRAEQAEQRAAQLLEQLRALGVEPDA